jgi:hypothetical protein
MARAQVLRNYPNLRVALAITFLIGILRESTGLAILSALWGFAALPALVMFLIAGFLSLIWHSYLRICPCAMCENRPRRRGARL